MDPSLSSLTKLTCIHLDQPWALQLESPLMRERVVGLPSQVGEDDVESMAIRTSGARPEENAAPPGEVLLPGRAGRDGKPRRRSPPRFITGSPKHGCDL